jgi:hypothetical protein
LGGRRRHLLRNRDAAEGDRGNGAMMMDFLSMAFSSRLL